VNEQRFATVELSDPRWEVDGLRHATVFSRNLGRRGDCTFWWPRRAEGPLPLVILLHGVYGSHWAWALQAGAHQIASNLIESGATPPFALAMPSDGLFWHGSGYVRHSGGDFAQWIVGDVPALASHVIGSVDHEAPFALGGLSMGGFGALMLGAHHAERVSSVLALSAITDFSQMEIFVGALDRYDVDARWRSVADAFAAASQPPPVYLACGSDDLLIEHNRELHRALMSQTVDCTWIEGAGGHEWEYWHRHLPDALIFAAAHTTQR
jgi:putative tributyrin esterase